MIALDKHYQDFIYHIQFVEPLSKNTVENYRRDVEEYIRFLKRQKIEDIDQVTHALLIEYFSDMTHTLQPASISRKRVSVRQFHRYLHRFGRAQFNPTTLLSSHKEAQRIPKAVSIDSVRTLVSFEKELPKDFLDFAIILLLFRCGLRVSECVDLSFQQYNEHEGWLRILGKGNKERFVPISKDANDALKAYIKTTRPICIKKQNDAARRYIFFTLRGNRITRQYVHEMLQYRCNETGVNEHISAHTLRHTFATTLLDAGVDLRIIQELLGHEDIQTTQIYTHVKRQTLKNEYERYMFGDFDFEGDD